MRTVRLGLLASLANNTTKIRHEIYYADCSNTHAIQYTTIMMKNEYLIIMFGHFLGQHTLYDMMYRAKELIIAQ